MPAKHPGLSRHSKTCKCLAQYQRHTTWAAGEALHVFLFMQHGWGIRGKKESLYSTLHALMHTIHPVGRVAIHRLGLVLGSLLDPIVLVTQGVRRPQVTTSGVTLKVLGPGGAAAKPAQLSTRLWVPDFLVGACAKVLADPKTTSVLGCLPCRQDMVCADTLSLVSNLIMDML